MSPDQEKIIAFELDFFQLEEDYSLKELNQLFNLLRELGIYNNLFLLTNNSLQLANRFLKEKELNIGYLISNSGACVYNLITNKKERESFLDKEVLNLILRFSFFNNLVFVIHCSNQSFIFGIYYLSLKKQRLYSTLSSLKSLEEIKKIIDNNDTYSLEILFREKNFELRSKKIKIFLKTLLEEFQININYLVVDDVIYLFSNSQSKLKIISETTETKEEEISNNLIYSSWTIPDNELSKKSFLWLSFSELADFIFKESPSNSVIFLTKNSKAWIDWWEEHNYLWKENLFKLDWIFRKIKKLESEGIKKTNCFELDLFSGLLVPKEINEKLNTWEFFQRKIFGEREEDVITLFLWPEQLNMISNSNKIFLNN